MGHPHCQSQEATYTVQGVTYPLFDRGSLSAILVGSSVSLINLAGVTLWLQVAQESTLSPVTEHLVPGSLSYR